MFICTQKFYLEMEIYNIRTARFCPHENVYALNYKVKLYAKRCMLEKHGKNVNMQMLNAYYDGKSQTFLYVLKNDRKRMKTCAEYFSLKVLIEHCIKNCFDLSQQKCLKTTKVGAENRHSETLRDENHCVILASAVFCF